MTHRIMLLLEYTKPAETAANTENDGGRTDDEQPYDL